ncbi:MAG TPA: hypothetical protein VGI82_12870 [Chitinophagaceae bacterium]
MMKRSIGLTTALLLFFFCKVFAQDTLPAFSVHNVGNNRIIISWKNNYSFVRQISIQRSSDSLKSYKTILSVPDPMNRQNGYADTRAPSPTMFYRLFLVFEGSSFMFSNSKRPIVDSVQTAAVVAEQKKSLDPFSIEVNKPVKNIDSTLRATGTDNKNKPNIWVPSVYVYTAKDGNIHLTLPETDTKKYAVKFYDENDNFLFEVKDMKESSLIIDKTNFYHAGWFKFELFSDDKLKEKNKFYIGKEF